MLSKTTGIGILAAFFWRMQVIWYCTLSFALKHHQVFTTLATNNSLVLSYYHGAFNYHLYAIEISFVLPPPPRLSKLIWVFFFFFFLNFPFLFPPPPPPTSLSWYCTGINMLDVVTTDQTLVVPAGRVMPASTPKCTLSVGFGIKKKMKYRQIHTWRYH